MEVILGIASALLLASAAFGFWRLWKGPLLTDRVVALDLIGMVLVGGIVTAAIYYDRAVYLDAAAAFAMVSFVATVGIARFLEDGGGAE